MDYVSNKVAGERRVLRARLRLLWFDFWVGWYFDTVKRVLYLCPLPMVVFSFWVDEVAVCSYCGASMVKQAFDAGDGWVLFWQCPEWDDLLAEDGVHPADAEEGAPIIEWPFPHKDVATAKDLEEVGFELV